MEFQSFKIIHDFKNVHKRRFFSFLLFLTTLHSDNMETTHTYLQAELIDLEVPRKTNTCRVHSSPTGVIAVTTRLILWQNKLPVFKKLSLLKTELAMFAKQNYHKEQKKKKWMWNVAFVRNSTALYVQTWKDQNLKPCQLCIVYPGIVNIASMQFQKSATF